MLSTELVERILAYAPLARIGLVGDLFLDRYWDIDPILDEPSVETRLVAYQVVNVRHYPGALGTVAANLSALGVGRIVPITVIGDDGEGYELLRAMKALPGVDASNVLQRADRRTPTYSKPMIGGREANRLDQKNRTPTPPDAERELIRRIEQSWGGFDGILVLDQVSERNCGVVTDAVRAKVEEFAASRSPFTLADSRELIAEFRTTAIKPNKPEWDAAKDVAIGGRTVFRTDGERGIDVLRSGVTIHVPGYPVVGPVDICGAGDSCSAGILLAKAAGCSDAEAAAFGNLVASITVQQIGVTGTATPVQVRARWADVSR